MSYRVHTPTIASLPFDGGYFILDDREGTSWVETKEELARYIAERSPEAGFVPLGTIIKKVLATIGVKRDCLPCAERQAKLDRLIRKG